MTVIYRDLHPYEQPGGVPVSFPWLRKNYSLPGQVASPGRVKVDTFYVVLDGKFFDYLVKQGWAIRVEHVYELTESVSYLPARVMVDDARTYDPKMIAPKARKFGVQWCHMWTDANQAENFHCFADRIGAHRSWYQEKNQRFLHYDLTPKLRTFVSLQEWIRESYESSNNNQADA